MEQAMVEPSEMEYLNDLEGQLFAAREGVEILWLKMGEVCREIIKKKLYRLKQDENGNYFRTFKSYADDLEKRFRERGLAMGYTTLNRFVGNHRLYKEEMGLDDEDMVVLGKANLERLAPAVHKLQKEQGDEAAQAFMQDVLESARANGGLPLHEVDVAIDEATGRVTKGLETEFVDGLFGRRLKRLVLWWGGAAIDIMKQEVTEEQAQWLAKRLAVKLKDPSPSV